MPHVVIEGDVSLPDLFEKLELPSVRDGADVRKVVDVYLNRARNTLLLESIVVERGRMQKFVIVVGAKGRGASVRLLPMTDPEKTDGVLRLLAEVARRVRALSPGSRYGRTNLGELLEA